MVRPFLDQFTSLNSGFMSLPFSIWGRAAVLGADLAGSKNNFTKTIESKTETIIVAPLAAASSFCDSTKGTSDTVSKHFRDSLSN
jgi:hypothetical protein